MPKWIGDKLVTYTNSNNMCLVCFKEPKDNFNLIKHAHFVKNIGINYTI